MRHAPTGRGQRSFAPSLINKTAQLPRSGPFALQPPCWGACDYHSSAICQRFSRNACASPLNAIWVSYLGVGFLFMTDPPAVQPRIRSRKENLLDVTERPLDYGLAWRLRALTARGLATVHHALVSHSWIAFQIEYLEATLGIFDSRYSR